MPLEVLLAVDDAGVAERWAFAQGCAEFGSDALIDNETSAAAHRALGFVETAQIRCFRKVLAPPWGVAPSEKEC